MTRRQSFTILALLATWLLAFFAVMRAYPAKRRVYSRNYHLPK